MTSVEATGLRPLDRPVARGPVGRTVREPVRFYLVAPAVLLLVTHLSGLIAF